MGSYEYTKQGGSKKYGGDGKGNGNGKKTQPLNVLDIVEGEKISIVPRPKTDKELLGEELLPQMLINLPKTLGDDDLLVEEKTVAEFNKKLRKHGSDADLKTKEGQLEALVFLHPQYVHMEDLQKKVDNK